MEKTKIQVLSTRPLNPSWVNEAIQQGIEMDELAFIETEPILSVEVQQEIEQTFILSSTVVFTSMNGVEAVANFLEGNQPDWTIYCIGTATTRLVEEFFGKLKIAGTANDATSLASLIVEDRFTNEIIFFCGDQRRDELPAILRDEHFHVNEIIVYQTIAVPHKINKAYNGILFFSPSAVESFFRKNDLPGNTVLFAIGNTTAGEIKKYTTNPVIIASEPGKQNLLNEAIEYFT